MKFDSIIIIMSVDTRYLFPLSQTYANFEMLAILFWLNLKYLERSKY